MSEDLGNGGIAEDLKSLDNNSADSSSDAFLNLLSDEFKDSKLVRKYKGDPNEIIKALENANSLIGSSDKIPRLKEDATPEEKLNWRKEYLKNVPESEDVFEFKRIEGDYDFDENEEKEFRRFMFERNIPKEYAEDVWDMFHKKSHDAIMSAKSDRERMREEREAGLKAEWGDAYEAKNEAAEKVWKTFADEEISKKVKATDLVPEIRKALAKISEKVFDESPSVKVPTGTKQTSQGAKQAYLDFMRKNLRSLQNDGDPEHVQNKRKLHELRQLAENS